MSFNQDYERRRSINYGNEGETPLILEFNSLDLDDDIPNSNSFRYNSREDIYRINSIKKPIGRNNSSLEKIDEENENYYRKIMKDEEYENLNILNPIVLKDQKLYKFYIIMFCYLLFSLIELFFGYFSNSLVMMADAAYYFSESSCFFIYIITINIIRKIKIHNTLKIYYKGKIISILGKSIFILGLSFWLLYYTFKRFILNRKVNGLIIIVIGIVSILFNIIISLILMIYGINDTILSEKENNYQRRHSQDHLNYNNLKEFGIILAFKALQSSIILFSGILAYFFPTFLYIDPSFCLFLILVLLYKDFNQIGLAIKLLMKELALYFSLYELEKDLLKVEGVLSVHDLQINNLNDGSFSLNCHIITSNPQKSLILSRDIIKQKYKVNHITIQVELSKEKKSQKKKEL